MWKRQAKFKEYSQKSDCSFLFTANTHYCMHAGVAVPATLTATMLAKGSIEIKGVIPPEGLEPEQFLAKLAEKGWSFQQRITKEIRP